MSSDPRVAALDTFTSTTHSRPSPTLLSAVHNDNASLSTILILGASRGIGAATAHTFALAGARHLILASTASSAAALAAVAAAIRRSNAACRVDVRECDVADAGSVEAMAAYVECVITTGERLDAVVLNAGYSGDVELRVTDGGAADVGQWARAFAVNAVGTYLVARFFVPLLLRGGEEEGRGRKAFLVVGSIAAGIRRGIIANSKYCVSKMAQVRVVEHVAEQFGAQGLLAVAVHPGAVETAMAVETAPEAFMKYLVDDPELCGHFLVWLTRVPGRFQWLNGRLVSANWDPDELLAKKDEIVAKDLLKFEVRTE